MRSVCGWLRVWLQKPLTDLTLNLWNNLNIKFCSKLKWSDWTKQVKELTTFSTDWSFVSQATLSTCGRRHANWLNPSISINSLIPGCCNLELVIFKLTPRADCRLAPSRWETSLQSNTVSHWLGVNLESTLHAKDKYLEHVLWNCPSGECHTTSMAISQH